MNTRPEDQKEEQLTDTALHSTEGADVLQTVEEAIDNDEQLSDDLTDNDIISLDASD